MTDDPREILKAAGVECPELEAFENLSHVGKDSALVYFEDWQDAIPLFDAASDTIIALANIVAAMAKERDLARKEG